MIWQCTEILAVIVECMIVTRMLIQYFKFRSEDYRILKWLLLFSLLFATDMAGTFGIANETFLISSCLLIEIAFSTIFLKGNIFEKILISVINYVLVYFINLPVMSAISAITDISMLQLRDSQNVERIACLFLTKLLFFASTQFILSFRKKEEYHFKRNEWIIILSAFLFTLFIGFAIHLVIVNDYFTAYVYLAIALLLTGLDGVIFIFLIKIGESSEVSVEKTKLPSFTILSRFISCLVDILLLEFFITCLMLDKLLNTNLLMFILFSIRYLKPPIWSSSL